MNSIEKITLSITDDALAYAGDVKKKADEESARLIAEATAKGAKASAEILSRGKKECEAVESRAVSSADVLERNILLDAKSVLIDEVYTLATEELKKLPESRYLPFLTSLLLRSVDGIGEEEDDGFGYVNKNADLYTVTLNKADKEKYGKALISSVKSKVEGKKCRIVLSEKDADIAGGMFVRRGDIEINASLEMLIKDAREETGSEVLGILFSV